MNERLKNAMAGKHINVGKIAQETGADPKTVQRWVNGRVPHPRHRWTISKLLAEREDYLWPGTTDVSIEGSPKTSEIISAYARRTDVPVSAWWEQFTKAESQIDLLGYAMLFLPEQHPDLAQLLIKKSERGCNIRLALADPDSPQVSDRDDEEGLGGTLPGRIKSTLLHLRELQGKPSIEMAYHRIPLYNSIFRFDGEMFVTPHMYGLHGSKAPLLHLRNLGKHGIFANFAEHFEAVWANATPIPQKMVASSVRAKVGME